MKSRHRIKKIPTVLFNILHNKWVLYLVAFLSIYTIITYMCRTDIARVLIFIGSATITSYFTRNMIIVLGIPLILSIISNHIYFEGFTEDSSSEPSTTESDTKKSTAQTSIPDIILPSDEMESAGKTESTPNEVNNNTAEQYTNRINYAQTLGENMKSYRELLGADGFAQMTKDTQELLHQQEQLGNSIRQFAPVIEKMTPFLTQASGLLSKLDSTHLQEITKTIKTI